MNEELPEPNNVLFVSNMTLSTTEKTLREFFRQFSKETVKVHLLRNYGKPIGKAYITFTSVEDATCALEHTKGMLLNKRKVSIAYAKQRPMKVPQSSQSTQKVIHEKKRECIQEEQEYSKTVILVHNLDYSANDYDLRELFSEFQPVKAVVFKKKTKDGTMRSMGIGKVIFLSEEMQEKAIASLHNTKYKNRKIRVVKGKREDHLMHMVSSEDDQNQYEDASDEECVSMQQKQPFVIKHVIPLEKYYSNGSVTFRMNELQLEITLNPELVPGKQFFIPNGYRYVDGSENDLIIELDVEHSDVFERKGNDLYLNFLCGKEDETKMYAGEIHNLQLTMINKEMITTTQRLVDGLVIDLDRKGFISPENGERGTYHFIVKLI